MVFYYRKKDIEENHSLFCVYQSDTKLNEEEVNNINKKQNNLLDDIVTYESDLPFIGYPILEENTIRPATIIELINLGIQELQDGEYIEGDELIRIEKPSWQYIWNKELKKWIPNKSKLQDGEYIEEDKIIVIKYDSKLNYINPKWDNINNEWIDDSTQEEKLEYYKNKIISTNREILAYEVSGFDNLKLREKLKELTKIHNEIAFDIASIQNINMK